MYSILAVLVGGLVSSLIRILPLTLIRKPIKNKFLRSFLYYVPYVTLSVMTFPAILYATDSVWAGLSALILGIILSFWGLGLLPVAIFCCLTVFILQFFTPYENAVTSVELITNLDFKILNLIQENLRCKFLDGFNIFISSLGNFGIFWILSGIVLIIFKKYRKIGILALISLFVSFLIFQGILKPIFNRLRPFEQNLEFLHIIKPPFSSSFPSGHTTSAFAFTFLLMLKKTKFFIPSLVIAIFIAFSRLYIYVHFPSDVICGIIVGFLSAFIVFFVSKKVDLIKNKKKNI